MCMFYPYACICPTFSPGTCRDRKTALDPTELELWVTVSQHRNQEASSPLGGQQMLLPAQRPLRLPLRRQLAGVGALLP